MKWLPLLLLLTAPAMAETVTVTRDSKSVDVARARAQERSDDSSTNWVSATVPIGSNVSGVTSSGGTIMYAVNNAGTNAIYCVVGR